MTKEHPRPDAVAPSGDPIYRYGDREKPYTFAVPSDDAVSVEAHVSSHFGPIDGVSHEIMSDLVHLDVHFVKPSVTRPFHLLVTTGMSDLAMTPPPGTEGTWYAELLIALPPDWPVDDGSLKVPEHSWPYRALKYLARFPHEFDTCLWQGHTVPNGDPPGPISSTAKFTCFLLGRPRLFPEQATVLKLRPEKHVHFFAVFPIFTDEMNLKLRKGSGALFQLLQKHGVTELVDPSRKSVAPSWRRRLSGG